MPWQNVNSVAVVVARRFNPTIIRERWLERHGVIRSDEQPREGAVFTDVAVQFETDTFQLLVLPEQLQFTPRGTVDQQHEAVNQRLTALIRSLPETPYVALGLNTTWHLLGSSDQILEVSRRLFCRPDVPLFQRFDTASSHFGGYMSKDFGRLRLKLDVKPLTLASSNGVERRLQFAFNFHSDVFAEENQPEAACERLAHWNEVMQEADAIVHLVALE